MNKKSLRFKNKITINEIDKYKRKNSKFSCEMENALKIAKKIGGTKELVKRSIERASGKCSCFKCKDKNHNHDTIINNNDEIKHCANVTI